MKETKDILSVDFSDTFDEDFILEYDDYTDYEYLKYDNISPGYYSSLIVNAEPSVTSKGDKSFDVYYKMVSLPQYNAWHSYKIDDVKMYYVKQRYKKGSDPYKKFTKAMVKAGLPKRFSIDDVEGIMEIVCVNYPKDDNMGSFVERVPHTTNNGAIFKLDEIENDELDD